MPHLDLVLCCSLALSYVAHHMQCCLKRLVLSISLLPPSLYIKCNTHTMCIVFLIVMQWVTVLTYVKSWLVPHSQTQVFMLTSLAHSQLQSSIHYSTYVHYVHYFHLLSALHFWLPSSYSSLHTLTLIHYLLSLHWAIMKMLILKLLCSTCINLVTNSTHGLYWRRVIHSELVKRVANSRSWSQPVVSSLMVLFQSAPLIEINGQEYMPFLLLLAQDIMHCDTHKVLMTLLISLLNPLPLTINNLHHHCCSKLPLILFPSFHPLQTPVNITINVHSPLTKFHQFNLSLCYMFLILFIIYFVTLTPIKNFFFWALPTCSTDTLSVVLPYICPFIHAASLLIHYSHL